MIAAVLALAVTIPAPLVPSDVPAAVEVEGALLKVKDQSTMLEAPAGVYLNERGRQDIEEKITIALQRAVAAEADAAVLREALLQHAPESTLNPWVVFGLGVAGGVAVTWFVMSR